MWNRKGLGPSMEREIMRGNRDRDKEKGKERQFFKMLLWLSAGKVIYCTLSS